MTVSLPDHADVIAPPPLLFLGALVAGFALEIVWPTSFVAGFARIALGTALLAAGTAVMRAGFRAQRRAGTTIPTHLPTDAIASDGAYAWSRNPLYLGLMVLYSGAAVFGDSLWVLGLLVPLFAVLSVGVVSREEAYLERKFGDAYRAYRARVRRWI